MSEAKRSGYDGPEAVAGHIGVVRAAESGEARVFVDGALWRAQPLWFEGESERLHEGDPVVVERVKGLTLGVRKADEWEVLP